MFSRPCACGSGAPSLSTPWSVVLYMFLMSPLMLAFFGLSWWQALSEKAIMEHPSFEKAKFSGTLTGATALSWSARAAASFASADEISAVSPVAAAEVAALSASARASVASSMAS